MQISRLFEIVYLLLDKKSITANELAAHFEVSKRTILRDIETLTTAGIPIYTSRGKGGGISILDNFVLNKGMVSTSILPVITRRMYMSRPTTKSDLIKAANEQFDKMWKLIDSMPDGAQDATFNFGEDSRKKEAHWKRDKNLRDVLIHLYEWHQLLLSWVKANQSGDEKPFLPKPYNWKTYGDMNVEFWEKHQNTPYSKSREIVKESHAHVLAVIETFSNNELFTKQAFSWTGGSTLGSYCVSVTASHYDWALKKIKEHLKSI